MPQFRSRCETVFAVPPAKTDIATAILTNVIEHLVLLFPPNKHAFTAKPLWTDFTPAILHQATLSTLSYATPRLFTLKHTTITSRSAYEPDM